MVATPPPRFPPGVPPVPWRSSLELFAIQLAVVAVGIGLMLATPVGLSPLFFWTAGALLFGAWAWAVRIGRARGLLVRPALQVVARRVALLGGVVVGLSYILVACVPGQLALPWFMVAVVALALGVGAAFACLILTLCGLDAARPTSPPT